jgi:4-diphosphocytidyl-2-C-methyl-D-erythritol kinase
MKVILKAPAKINLFLEITGKRPDGYHDIESIMQTVSLYDEISAEETRNGEISVECDDNNIPSGSGNIAYKAAKALKERFGIQKGVKIRIKKEIPLGAGLGGGSSDAGAVIKALLRVWNIKSSKEELEKIAAKIGADVAFFLTCGTALCKGIGEIVTPLKSIRKMPLVLVNPRFGVPTAAVYKKVKFPLTNQRRINKIKTLIESGSFNGDNASGACFNRLEEFVFPDYPEIEKIRNLLAQLGCAGIMSGSGATVFGIFGSQSQSEMIKAKLKESRWFWREVVPV